MRPVFLVAAVAALVASAFVAGGSAHTTWKVEARGQVKCESGKHVVGVWIDFYDSNGGGFAQYHHWDSPDQAKYEYRLPPHTKYGVHVGCGGSHHDWATNNKSTRADWAKPDQHPHWMCVDHHPPAHSHHKIHTCYRLDVGHPAG